MKLIPSLLCDFYKLGHRPQYPAKTELVYANWTARSGKFLPGAKGATFLGMQAFAMEFLIEYMDTNFFRRPQHVVSKEYESFVQHTMGDPHPETMHIIKLHQLGYMPLEIRALKEGTVVPFGVPMATIHNTKPEFFWLTNYIETLLSTQCWKPTTVATKAGMLRQLLNSFAIQTTGSTEGVEYQAHDFSMRGMSGLEDAARCGVGHLLHFKGTDTATAIMYAQQYYGADIKDGAVGGSVNATEHSVMCAGGVDNEIATYRRLITQVHPTGLVSIVSDTWDLWYVLEHILPALKDSILARGDGPMDKVVIRPDSGDPLKIICGDPKAVPGSAEWKGVISLLDEHFGSTVNEFGCKVLDSHVGAIYGEKISLQTAHYICLNLKAQGYATPNVVFGIGSYEYNFVTRDTLGMAMKSTLVVVDGVERHIFKDPVTDDGTKKSATGYLAVVKGDKGLKLIDGLKFNEKIEGNLLEPLFKDGVLLRFQGLEGIREIVRSGYGR